MVIDHARGLLEVVLPSGAVVIERARRPVGSGGFSRSEYDLSERKLTLVAKYGQRITVEVGTNSGDDLRSRAVVYLDQCHWITLARHLYSPQKVPAGERDACDHLIELVGGGSVVLPLSAAHLVETARADGRWRRDVAMTMLTLSRGWQLISPVAVRRAELQASLAVFCGRRPQKADRAWPFTLQPDALFVDRTDDGDPPSGRSSLPAPLRELKERLSGVTAVYEVLLEDEIDGQQTEGVRMATMWAQDHQRLADYMRSVQMGPQHARINATAALLADLQDEIAIAAMSTGVNAAAMSSWAAEAADQFAHMPFLGRLLEVIYHRLRNAGSKWEANDLNDIMFLTCAAGYAHVVVGENQTIDFLKRAGRGRTSGAELASTLHDSISAIERRGDEAARS